MFFCPPCEASEYVPPFHTLGAKLTRRSQGHLYASVGWHPGEVSWLIPTLGTQRRGVKFKDAACLRPDCDFPGGAEDTNEYFVERIIGRRPYMADIDISVKTTSDLMWLVKWDGYATVLPQ